jgi:hypothetical protein
LRPRLPPECCGFTPPPGDFLPMPPFTNRLEDWPPPPPGDLRSRSRASLQKCTQRTACCSAQSESNLALRFAAKKAPDICRALSVCLRCCFVDFVFPLAGTGFPSVRSFRACEVIKKDRKSNFRAEKFDLGLAADFFLFSLCSSFSVHAGDAIF